MTNPLFRIASLGSVALLALLLTACDDSGEDSSDSSDPSSPEATEGEDDAQADSAQEEPDEDAEAADAGTRDDPLPLGETVESDDWAVAIESYTPNADEQISAENQFNDPAPEGHSYALIEAAATYTGEESDMVMMGVEIAYVTDTGETINAWDSMAVAPDELDSSTELYHGGSASGNVALALPEEGDGLIRVRLGFLDQEEAFFTTQ